MYVTTTSPTHDHTKNGENQTQNQTENNGEKISIYNTKL